MASERRLGGACEHHDAPAGLSGRSKGLLEPPIALATAVGGSVVLAGGEVAHVGSLVARLGG